MTQQSSDMAEALRSYRDAVRVVNGRIEADTPVRITYGELERIIAALEASHHAELVEELKRARAYLCCSVATTNSVMRPLYSKDDLGERIKAITDLLAKIGASQ